MMNKRFKQSDIGLIPEDWELRPIESSFDFVGNNTLSRESMSEKGAVVNIHYGDVLIKYGATVDVSSDQAVFIDSAIRTKAIHALQNGDIVMADTAEDETAGKCCEIIGAEGKQVEAGLHTFVLRPKDLYASQFLGYAFNAACYHNQLLPYMQGTKVTSITKGAVGKTYILCPPLEEQKRIAQALSDVDNLISSLDKLIEKKKNIKQGAMQQLLTGKKRLKGFSEPWVMKQLGKIGNTFSGLTGKTKDDFGTGNAKYITFLNVLNNPILKSELFEAVVVRDGERQNNCHKGDIFFNTSSETPEEVGICAMLDTEMDSLYLNSFCFGYRLNDNNIVPEYLAYYFRSNKGRKLMAVLAQGVTRYNLSKSAFNNAKILMPASASEQKAIVSVLASMDNEISALEAKKAKYESIKQGMMQELLTGKIRLI